jgi:hypothetical protein
MKQQASAEPLSRVPKKLQAQNSRDEDRLFWHLIAVFSASVGMIGVCVTTIGLVRLLEHVGSYVTLFDEILVADALVFLVSSGVSFVALRRRVRNERAVLAGFVDLLFFTGLIVLVGVCAMFAWFEF